MSLTRLYRIADLQATVAELKTAACALFERDEKDVEVCDYYNGKIFASLEGAEKAAKKLEDAQISGPQHILIGEKVRCQNAPLPSVSDMIVSICQSSGCGIRMSHCRQLLTCLLALACYHNTDYAHD